MSENVEGLKQGTVVLPEGMTAIPEGSSKYIHIPSGVHFGVKHDEVMLVGDIGTEHADIVKGFFQSEGTSEISDEDIKNLGYTNAGFLLNRNSKCILRDNSAGLKVQRPNGTRVEMNLLSPQEKIEADRKSLNLFRGNFPNTHFFSKADQTL